MKTSQSPNASHTCPKHLNQMVCIGSFVILLGLSGGGLILTMPTRLGVAAADAPATSIALSVASLLAGAILLAIGATNSPTSKGQGSPSDANPN